MADITDKKCNDGPKEESPISEAPSHTRDGIDKAVEAEENNRASGWWGDWISLAKDKSAEVLGMVKKDLDELSTAVKSEASHVINSTSSTITKTLRLDEPESTANTMKKSFSTFLDQVNTVLNPSPDDEDTEVFIITNGEPVPISSTQEIVALQRLDATYLVAPEGESLERLEAWRKVHSFPSAAALERQLKNAPVLKEKLERLVPAALSDIQFWERYLYRKALLEDRLCNPGASVTYLPSDPVVSSLLGDVPLDTATDDSVKSNCGSTPPPNITEGDNDITWDNDFAVDVDLSEEQQTKLLEEYEAEIRFTKVTNTLPLISDTDIKTSPTKSASSPQLKQLSKDDQLSRSKPTTNKPLQKSKISKAKSSSETVINVQKTMGKILIRGKKNQASKTSSKSDLQSKMVEDHFNDKKNKKKQKSLSDELAEKAAIDSASSNSDESWEKEFEFDETEK